jgi:hypothetical protein
VKTWKRLDSIIPAAMSPRKARRHGLSPLQRGCAREDAGRAGGGISDSFTIFP